jgi:RNA polymerase sigma factor (sigma-70 family)
MTSDRALTRRLAIDLDSTFPEVVRVHQNGLYAGALRLTGSPHDAEDVTQETFVRAYRALGGYAPDRVEALKLRAWLWTIAANLCRNHARSRARRPTSPLVDDLPGTRPDHEADLDLAAALLRVPLNQRMPVVMRHVVGMSTAEIAAALGRPEGTVKAQIHRALAALREDLEDS